MQQLTFGWGAGFRSFTRAAVWLLGVIPVLLAAPGILRGQSIGSCPVLPADNIWNTAVDSLPVHSSSSAWVNTIGASRTFHADFGSGLWDGGPIGIPYVLVNGQAKVPVRFEYSDESDPGPYPVPANPPIEGGPNSSGDRHILIVDQSNCYLYELYSAYPEGGGWRAGSGAIYNLRSNALRPAGWTSADAAGLPILPGLVRYEEVLAGEIRHAIRFTAPQTRKEYIWPARHYASSRTGAEYPPMGARFRLKANFDISGYSAANQVILRAMKKYGIILADNGSAWYLSGAPDERWNNDDLHALGRLTGANFEAVDASGLMMNANSGQARGSAPGGGTVTAVVSAAGFRPGVAAGGWVTVFGTNLAASARNWREGEIVNGRFPTQLDGTAVSFGGVAAAISYISPTQLNVQAPDAPTGSSIPLQVTTPTGNASYTVNVVSLAPSLFTYDAEGGRYAAAQHAGSYAPVGRSGLYANSIPARPGGDVILYGTGFGPTREARPSGYLVVTPSRLSLEATVRIGGRPAEVLWAGLSAAGLCQINVRVPGGLPAGDAAVVAEVAGASTQAGVYLTIGPP